MIKNVLSALLILSVVLFSFTSCDKDDKNDDDTLSLDKKQGVSVSGNIGGYTYVDLGLKSGTKWSTYNVGATKPTEYGNLYAWGETEVKGESSDAYTNDNYKWSVGDSMIKYGADSVMAVEATDDAATVNWGSGWKMPSVDDFNELREGCDWVFTNDYNGSGVAGVLGKSRFNGKIIFFAEKHESMSIFDVYCSQFWTSTLVSTAVAYGYSFWEDSIGEIGSDRYHDRYIRAIVNQ